jgi:hypothetical protein
MVSRNPFFVEKGSLPPLDEDAFKDEMPTPKRKVTKLMAAPRERLAEELVQRHEAEKPQKVEVKVTWSFAFGLLWRMVAIILPIAGIIQWILVMIAMGRNQ